MGKCILIGAGDFTYKSATSVSVSEDDYVIAVDGGYAYCDHLGIQPDLIVGDMDSLADDLQKKIENIAGTHPEILCRLPCEKDDTDMRFAIKQGLAKGYLEFVLYGALGGRLEHTIANIQCLLYLKNQGAKGTIVDERCSICLIQDETIQFPKEKEGFFSLFALQKQVSGVTIKGMKYPLKDAVLTEDYPIGISNEFIGKVAEVTVKDGMLLAIVSKK